MKQGQVLNYSEVKTNDIPKMRIKFKLNFSTIF